MGSPGQGGSGDLSPHGLSGEQGFEALHPPYVGHDVVLHPHDTLTFLPNSSRIVILFPIS